MKPLLLHKQPRPKMTKSFDANYQSQGALSPLPIEATKASESECNLCKWIWVSDKMGLMSYRHNLQNKTVTTTDCTTSVARKRAFAKSTAVVSFTIHGTRKYQRDANRPVTIQYKLIRRPPTAQQALPLKKMGCLPSL